MKAASNGVLNCTVADGWAAEVDWVGKCWTLDSDNISTSVYETLENQIVPTFYHRNEQGVPEDWVQMMQSSIELADHFSARRMVEEYVGKLYQ